MANRQKKSNNDSDPPIMQKQWQSAEKGAHELIHIICNGNDVDLVRTLDAMTTEQVRSTVTHVTRDGDTALHLAAVRGRLGGLAAMLRNQVDVNARDGSGNSSMFLCLSRYKMESVQLLLAHGADVNETVSRLTGETMLHKLVKADRREAVEVLLDAGIATGGRTRRGETAVHYAARFKRPFLTSRLLKVGCDVNAVNQNNETPLHVAIANKAFDVAKKLVKSGASLTIKDHQGMTPLHAAVFANAFELVKLMLTNASAQINAKELMLGRTPLLLACSHGNHKMASLLLSHGADANLTTNYRKSVLHVAAGCGNNGALGVVLKYTTNLNAMAINNKTALHCAVSARHQDVVKSLLRAGVNANLKDIDGNTALHLAASHGDNVIVTLLLNNGVQVNVTNMRQQTPVHLAFLGGHEAVGWGLVEAGGQLHLPDQDKTTPWQYYLLNRKMLNDANQSSSGTIDTSSGDVTQRSVRFQVDSEHEVQSEGDKSEGHVSVGEDSSASGVTTEDQTGVSEVTQGVCEQEQVNQDESNSEISAVNTVNCDDSNSVVNKPLDNISQSEDSTLEDNNTNLTEKSAPDSDNVLTTQNIRAKDSGTAKHVSDKRRQKSGHHKSVSSAASKTAAKTGPDKNHSQGKKQGHGQGHRLSFGQELEFMPSLRRNSKTQKVNKKDKTVGETPRDDTKFKRDHKISSTSSK